MWSAIRRELRGVPRADIPVFLLVGPGTALGTEDLAFIFKQSGRGTLVGERTSGAGRLTRTYAVGDGFIVSAIAERTTDASWRQFALRARDGVQARANAVTVPAKTLAEYAGRCDLR